MHERPVSPAKPWQVQAGEDVWLGKLARAAQAGDRNARDALWTAVGPQITHIAHRVAWTFPMLDRDDAVQEAFPIFATLVATWPGPDADGKGFATYLYGKFRWRLHSTLRGYERRYPPHIDWNAWEERTAISPPRAAPIAWYEYGVDFPAFVAALPAHERAIFVLRVREGLATGEIAARLSLKPRTVSRYWNITLRRLRAMVLRG
jgi:RNA polymerase sigma factor (sigma-70 family)